MKPISLSLSLLLSLSDVFRMMSFHVNCESRWHLEWLLADATIRRVSICVLPAMFLVIILISFLEFTIAEATFSHGPLTSRVNFFIGWIESFWFLRRRLVVLLRGFDRGDRKRNRAGFHQFLITRIHCSVVRIKHVLGWCREVCHDTCAHLLCDCIVRQWLRCWQFLFQLNLQVVCYFSEFFDIFTRQIDLTTINKFEDQQ